MAPVRIRCCNSATLLFATLAVAGGALQAVLLWRIPGSDSDFAGLCCFAESLSRGINPSNPYFPPLYPALLWLGVQGGLSCLQTAALLNGLGAALAIYHGCALWRRFGNGVAASLFGGAILLLLPDAIWTMQMAHTDTLMLGLLAVWLHAAVAAWRGELHRELGAGAVIAGVIAALSRWHLALALLPVLIVLALARRPETRRYALQAALPVLLALAAAYGLLYAATGELATSAKLQVFTGLAITADDPSAAITAVTEDYASFAESHRLASLIAEAGWGRLVQHTLRNWLSYLLVRATMLGLLAFLIAGALWRNWPKGAIWLVVFALGYSLAISPSYFVYRASCAIEWCGLMLLGAALACASAKLNSWPWRIGGAVLCALVLVYGVPRALGAYHQAITNRRAPLSTLVHQLASDPHVVVGFNDYNWCPGAPPWNLPAASLNRLWVDDPVLDRLTQGYPRYTMEEVTSGQTPVRAIVINSRERWQGIAVVRAWAQSSGFIHFTGEGGYEVWIERGLPAPR